MLSVAITMSVMHIGIVLNCICAWPSSVNVDDVSSSRAVIMWSFVIVISHSSDMSDDAKQRTTTSYL
jgi:hypothetical protein